MVFNLLGIPFNIDYWLKKFEENYEGQVIYFSDDGNKNKDFSPYFEQCSRSIKKRGYLTKNEFISIGDLKAPSATNWYFKNSEKEIEEITRTVFEINSLDGKIEKLMQLKGVGVPVSSAILTVLYPEQYCIYNYNTLRTLIWVSKDLHEYKKYYKALEWFKSGDVESYLKYHKNLEKIGKKHNKSSRKIEISFRQYDKAKGEKPEVKQKTIEDYL